MSGSELQALLVFYTFYFLIGMLTGISRICLQWFLYYSESFVLKTANKNLIIDEI